MKKTLVSMIMATTMAATTVFGTMPTMAAPVKSATETSFYKQTSKDCAFYRKIARKAIADDIKKGSTFMPDEVEIAVAVDESGQCLFFPDCNGDIDYGKCHADYVERGDVVAFAMQLDGNGECENVHYYVVDNGFYDRTDELLHTYFAQGGELS